MKKVMRLVRMQLWAVLGDMLSIGTNRKKKKPKVLYAGVALFIVMMSMISFFYCFMIGSGLKRFDSIDILPTMMMSVTCMIILLTTVLKVKGTIFGFRDYDMVMTLPIKTSGIVASRLIILYALNMSFVIMVMVPMTIAYGILAKPAAMFYVINMIAMLFMPLVPIVIASFLGTFIAYVASKFRYSNVLNIIFSVGLLVAIVVLPSMMKNTGSEMVDMSKALTGQVNSIYPLSKMYTKAVIDYDITAFLTFLAVSVIAFLLYTLLVQKVFKKINTIIMTGRSSVNYKMGELKTSSPLKALYIKELKRYFSSPLYVLNTGFGIVMLTFVAIAGIFVDLNEILGGPQATSALLNSGPIFLSFCIIMSCTTMASMSLEGKSLWIIKSLPVSPKTIYLSKIAVNLTIISPAVFDAILIGIVLKMGLLQTLFMVLVTIVCAVFISCYGLVINLLLPNFNWTTEAIVIKQSAASMVTIFTGFLVIGIQFLLLFFLPNATLGYLSYILVMVIIDAVLYRVLMSYGNKRFASL
ncbi:MAG: putative ABC transporter permease subunit [Mobilitalea sp.]